MKATFYIEEGLDDFVTPEDLEKLPIEATGFRSCEDLPITSRVMSKDKLELNVRYSGGVIIEPRHTDVDVKYDRKFGSEGSRARWESSTSSGLKIRVGSHKVYKLVNTLRD